MKNLFFPWNAKSIIKIGIASFSQDGNVSSDDRPEVIFKESKHGYTMIVKRVLEPAKIILDRGKKLISLKDENWTLPFCHLGEIDLDNHSVQLHHNETHIQLPRCHQEASDRLNKLAINWL